MAKYRHILHLNYYRKTYSKRGTQSFMHMHICKWPNIHGLKISTCLISHSIYSVWLLLGTIENMQILFKVNNLVKCCRVLFNGAGITSTCYLDANCQENSAHIFCSFLQIKQNKYNKSQTVNTLSAEYNEYKSFLFLLCTQQATFFTKIKLFSNNIFLSFDITYLT